MDIIMNKVINTMKQSDRFAKEFTTDPKTYVGAVVGTFFDGKFQTMGMGCNKNDAYNEKEAGRTYREFLFNGSRDKKYRPWDKIVHAEENAIVDALIANMDGKFDTAIVTRYPCEKCAQLMIYKGIKKVYYGRKFKISEESEELFAKAGVEVVHVVEYVGQVDDDNL